MSFNPCEVCGDSEAIAMAIIKMTEVDEYDNAISDPETFTVALCDKCRKALPNGVMIMEALGNPNYGRRRFAVSN